jgi:clan AA aspartic protease
MAGSSKAWTGQALVDTGATDTFLPASVLRKLGIQPSARRSYELADGTEQELPIGFGVIEVEGLAAGGTLVFAGEKEEPLLGVTVLESTGLWLDPQHERLIRRPPKRKPILSGNVLGGVIARCQRGQDNEDILAAVQGLSAADLDAALAYYRENSQEIDEAMCHNSDD